MRNEGVYQKLLAPLATSRSGLMMLLAGDLGQLTEQQQEYLQHILELDEYMISMITSWSDMERLSSGRVVLEVEPCNIGSIIKLVAKDGVELHRNAQWPMVLADQLRLKQIITNILDIFKKVEIRARTSESFCITTFHDHKVSTSAQRAAMTSSMGFQIAKLLAEAHGGSLELNPHATDGTRVHLKLPLAKQMSLLGE